MAPRIVPEQLMGCPMFLRKHRVNLNFSTERTQGHFLSPWSRHGSLCTKPPRYSLSSHPYGSRDPTDAGAQKSSTFIQDLVSIGINDMLFKRKWGGGGLEMVTKEEVVTKEEMVVVAKGKLRRSRWPRRNARR